MGKVKDTSYFTVQGWMLNQLNLKGNSLFVFAIIHGFSHSEENEYKGSIQYLCEFTGSSRSTVIRSLSELQELGFIEKREIYENGVKFNRYKSSVDLCVKYDTSCVKMTHPQCQNDTPPSVKMTHNNIDGYNRDNIDNKESPKKVFEEFAKDNEELLESLKAFEEMRKTIKKPLTEKAKQMVCNKLEKMAMEVVDKERYMIESLEQSTVNCYQGVFPVKDFQDKAKEKEKIELVWPEFNPDFKSIEELIP